MMSAGILQVEGLSIASGQRMIVSDLTFTVRQGEIVALTGKSGSGKTSIALALLGLLPSGLRQTKGNITWHPEGQPAMALPVDIAHWHTIRGSHIGYTQQDAFSAFDPILRMGEQMVLVIRERAPLHIDNIERELRTKMEEVGLHDLDRLWNSFPHQLSGGQLQRCQICMAIVIGPQLIISDEPTSAIDKINQLELLDVYAMLKAKYNMAILCITHEEAVVQYLADRVVQLDPTSSMQAPFTEPSPAVPPEGHAAYLRATQLTYTHQYGGMMYKQGATVGPIDFVLHRGACLGIIGESGSGKSTLAQLLVGLHTPSHGQIWMGEQQIDFSHPEKRKWLRNRIQLVMQDGRGSLHPFFTVERLLNEVVLMKRKEVPAYTLKPVDMLKEVGLAEEVLHRKPPSLSGGECLRVSIARALLMEPEVLICDESTAALDHQTRDGIISLLLRLLKDRNLSLIFISHDEYIIRGVAQDIVVLAQGRVVEKGPAAQVIRYPTHHMTKKIFSSYATLGHKRHP